MLNGDSFYAKGLYGRIKKQMCGESSGRVDKRHGKHLR